VRWKEKQDRSPKRRIGGRSVKGRSRSGTDPLDFSDRIHQTHPSNSDALAGAAVPEDVPSDLRALLLHHTKGAADTATPNARKP